MNIIEGSGERKPPDPPPRPIAGVEHIARPTPQQDRHLADGELGYWRECYRDQLARANAARARIAELEGQRARLVQLNEQLCAAVHRYIGVDGSLGLYDAIELRRARRTLVDLAGEPARLTLRDLDG